MRMRWATDGPTAQGSQGSRLRDLGPRRHSALHTPCPQGIAFRGLQQPGPPRPRCRELSAQHRGHDITSACRACPRHSHHTRGIYHMGSFHNAPPSGTYFQVRCRSHPQCVEAFRARQTSRCPQEACRAPRLTQSATAMVLKARAVDAGPTGRAFPNALTQSAPRAAIWRCAHHAYRAGASTLQGSHPITEGFAQRRLLQGDSEQGSLPRDLQGQVRASSLAARPPRQSLPRGTFVNVTPACSPLRPLPSCYPLQHGRLRKAPPSGQRCSHSSIPPGSAESPSTAPAQQPRIGGHLS